MFHELFVRLGFQPAGVVEKERFYAHLFWHHRKCKVAFDSVHGIGRFIEVETMAEPCDYEMALGCLEALALELELNACERRSYLELVLDQISA
jgi:adenylate cyclase class IV